MQQTGKPAQVGPLPGTITNEAGDSQRETGRTQQKQCDEKNDSDGNACGDALPKHVVDQPLARFPACQNAVADDDTHQ